MACYPGCALPALLVGLDHFNLPSCASTKVFLHWSPQSPRQTGLHLPCVDDIVTCAEVVSNHTGDTRLPISDIPIHAGYPNVCCLFHCNWLRGDCI